MLGASTSAKNYDREFSLPEVNPTKQMYEVMLKSSFEKLKNFVFSLVFIRTTLRRKNSVKMCDTRDCVTRWIGSFVEMPG